MKKALIFYLWGRKNAGDMAISLGAASLLIENGYDVTFVSRFTMNQDDYFDSKDYIKTYFNDIKVEPGLFELDRNKSSIHMIRSYVGGIKKLISPVADKNLKMLIEDSDMILLNGGNLLRGKSIVDYARIFALFYPFKIASKYKRKMIILPQSTASSSKLGMKLLKKKLLNFNIVFIRESNSFEVLNKEIKDVNFVKTTDVAFYISDNPIALAKYKEKYTEITPVNKKNIALILRSTTIGDLGEFDNDKKESMALNIINHIKEFNESYNIFLVVQTLKDKKFTEYIANKIEEKNRPIIIEEYDTFVLREIYKNMEFVIAMRLHAAILSMTSRTPVIGYFDREWGFKNPGIMNDVGLPWTEDGKKLIELSNKVITEKVKFVNLINEFIIKEKSKISNYI